MAATALRIPNSRTGTPTIPSPHPKQVVSLEDWESKAPLSEPELRSINVFQKAFENKPLPLKDSVDGIAPPRTDSPALNYDEPGAEFQNRDASKLGSKRPQGASNLSPTRPIQTTQEFYDWFAMIEQSVAHSQEAHYRDHLATVEKYLGKCDELSGNVDLVQHDVDDMLDGWRSVESGGRNLKDACEELLDERDRLIKLTEDIGARLEYFQELEHATRMLNHPGESLVLQADFLEMVERVDICIDFLRAHRHYREAEVYLLRFQQCLTRAMTLIKMYFVGSLKALTSDISRRMPDKEISSTAQMHLLYTRFQSVATQVAPLIGELERRTRSHPEELSALLTECHSAYFNARKALLIGRLAEEIKGLDPSRADLVELTRTGCSYLKQLCVDEFSIFRCFFNSGKELIYAYLENLCDYLYDDLRPRILHEPRLSVLCDVCKVLQALMVLDVPEAESSSDEDETYEQDGAASSKDKQGLGRLHISHMLQSVLQDAQTRLFFKAQTVVQTEIRYYVPKADDFDYPQRLIDARRRARANDKNERVDDSPFLRISSFRERESWYTTLQTTVVVLTQLHEFVQPSIFDDIAHEAIDFCRANLVTAANMISARSTPPDDLDAQLFLIRHLLVLKEMIGALNLANRGADESFDFRHVTETLRDMLRTTSLMPYAFASSLSKARDEVITTGAKEGVDTDLKRACESVIQLGARSATLPIHEFMLSLDAPSASSTTAPTSVSPSVSKEALAPGRDSKAAPPTRSAALSVEAAFRGALERAVPALAEKLRLYLADGAGDDGLERSGVGANATGTGTVAVLLGHVQERVVDAYVGFRRAADFLPVDETGGDGEDKSERAFASPEDIRTLFKALI